MLTMKKLEAMEYGKIFATGEMVDSPEGLNMTNSGRLLKWIAEKGDGGCDWAIYCHFCWKTVGYIKAVGDKVWTEHHIKKLVPCDDEVFKKYRY